ncbi:unnamed protein product, partial [Scytosiphon promiscuus]
MAPSSRLFRVGAAVLCATPRIGPADSFALRVPVPRAKSPFSSWSRVSCRPFPSATSAVDCRCWARLETTQDDALDERSQVQQGVDEQGGSFSSPAPSFPGEGAEQGSARSKVDGGDAARPEPGWVQDPSERRVKMWMRAAARKGDHNRVAMYLRKYREGKALRGEIPRVAVYNAALRALDQCKKWRLALSVFREMQSDGVKPDRDSFFFVMSACSKHGEAKTALALLAEMTAAHRQQPKKKRRRQAGGVVGGSDEGVTPAPDLLLYAVAIKACAWGKRWRQALRLLDEMTAAGVKPNVVVINTALSACAKCGQVARAAQLLEEMQEKYGVAPDVRSYNSLMSGHERAGEWREALALAKKMEEKAAAAADPGVGGEGEAASVLPNVVTFNSVIGACKRAGRSEEALAVLGMLRRKGVQPDVISFNSAIGACASGGKWEAALQLLELMPSEGVTPDLMTYNIALDACVKGGQWEMAMSLFEELVVLSSGDDGDENLRPDLYTYNTLMTVFSNAGMLPRALELLEEAKAGGLSPDVVTYSTLIRACERSMPSQPEVALQLVSDMEAAGVRPNNTTFVSVALSLGRAGRPLECLDLLGSMREKGTPPDAICYQAVLRVLDRWDRAEEASLLFDEMMTTTPATTTTTAAAAANATSGEQRVVALVPEIAEEAYCCGIRALEKLGKWPEAVSLLEQWREKGAYDADNDRMYDQWYLALRLLSSGGLPEGTDVKTARAAIVSAARGGLAEEALAIMRSMERNGFELGVVEYGAAIEAFEQAGKPERGLEMFDEMIAAGVEPDVLCFAAATRCCCRRLDWAAAISFIERTLREGLLPTSRTFEAVAGLCRNSARYEELWDLKELMRDIVVRGGGLARPGSSIYVSLIRACGAARRPDLVLRCIAEMNTDQAPGKTPGSLALDEPYTVSAAIGALSGCGETAEADRIYLDAIKRRILPDPAAGRTWATAAAYASSTTVAPASASGLVGPSSVSGMTAEGGAGREGTAGGRLAGGRQSRGQRDPVPRERGSGTAYRESSSGRGGRRGGSSVGAWDTQAGGVRAQQPPPPLLLWVDLRRAPVAVIPSAVRRVVKAAEAVGEVSEGLVVQWAGGARGAGEEAEEDR